MPSLTVETAQFPWLVTGVLITMRNNELDFAIPAPSRLDPGTGTIPFSGPDAEPAVELVIEYLRARRIPFDHDQGVALAEAIEPTPVDPTTGPTHVQAQKQALAILEQSLAGDSIFEPLAANTEAATRLGEIASGAHLSFNEMTDLPRDADLSAFTEMVTAMLRGLSNVENPDVRIDFAAARARFYTGLAAAQGGVILARQGQPPYSFEDAQARIDELRGEWFTWADRFRAIGSPSMTAEILTASQHDWLMLNALAAYTSRNWPLMPGAKRIAPEGEAR